VTIQYLLSVEIMIRPNYKCRHCILSVKGDTTTLHEVLSRFRATNESVDLVERLALVALTFTVETAGQLAPEGVAEHERIGYRTADNFKFVFFLYNFILARERV